MDIVVNYEKRTVTLSGFPERQRGKGQLYSHNGMGVHVRSSPIMGRLLYHTRGKRLEVIYVPGGNTKDTAATYRCRDSDEVHVVTEVLESWIRADRCAESVDRETEVPAKQFNVKFDTERVATHITEFYGEAALRAMDKAIRFAEMYGCDSAMLQKTLSSTTTGRFGSAESNMQNIPKFNKGEQQMSTKLSVEKVINQLNIAETQVMKLIEDLNAVSRTKLRTGLEQALKGKPADSAPVVAEIITENMIVEGVTKAYADERLKLSLMSGTECDRSEIRVVLLYPAELMKELPNQTIQLLDSVVCDD